MSDRDQIETLLARYQQAYRDGDAAGCAAVFTETCMLISSDGTVAKGQKAVAALHAEWLADGGEDKSLSMVDFGQQGDLAWCLARFADAVEQGLSLNVMRRGADGQWRIHICSLNDADLPADGA